MQSGVALRPLWALRPLIAGVSLVSLGSVFAGSAVRALLAGIALCAGFAFRARVALRALEVHGLRIRLAAVVRPRQVAVVAHARRERHAVASVCPVFTRRTVCAVFPGQAVRALCAVLSGVSLRSLNSLRPALAGLTLRALQGAVVDELAGNAVENVDVIGLCRAHAVGIARRCGRFLSGIQRSLCAVVAQHLEAAAGLPLGACGALLASRAGLPLRALFTLRTARAFGSGRSGRAGVTFISFGTGIALVAFQRGELCRRKVGIGKGIALVSLCTPRASGACLALNALLPLRAAGAGFTFGALRPRRTGCAGLSLGALCAGCTRVSFGAGCPSLAFRALLAGVALGADFALRPGRGNACVGKSVLLRIPLEPVASGLVDVWHLGNRRLRIRRRLQNLVDPASVGVRRLGHAVCAQRRLDHRAPRPALGDRAAHGVGELGHALARLCGVGVAQRPDHVTVLALKARGIWRAVTLTQHRQREDALAVQPRPTVRKAAPDDPLRLVLALMAQRQIRQLAHFDLSHTISYPLS